MINYSTATIDSWWKLSRNITLDNKVPEEMVLVFEQEETVLEPYKEFFDLPKNSDR